MDYLVKDRIEVEESAGQSKNPYGWNDFASDSMADTRRLEEKVDSLTRYMKGWQYTSKTKIKGIPLVSIRFSRQLGKDGVAKGIIAIGNVAVGVIALGAISVGVISFGALAAGLLAVGAGALGIISWGAMAIGVFAFGSAAVGIYSVGVAAYGHEIAVGVSAAGKTVVGESVRGTNCLTWYQGITAEEIRAFLAEHNPNLWAPLRDVLAVFGEYIH